MANPQIENGYIRIANELWDEIIRRDFSKRQRAIIDFIWRLSYGTRKRYAIIPQLKDFELAGIGKTHITKELKHLEACRVLSWDQQQNRFEITEDYERWQITPNLGWNEEKYADLIHLNIREATGSRNSNPVTETVTELPKQEPKKEEPSYRNGNRPVTKTVTEEGPEPYSGADFGAPKDSIKDSDYEKEKDKTKEQPPALSDFDLDQKKTAEITSLLYSNGFGVPGSVVLEDLNYWIERGPFEDPHDVIIEAIKEAARTGASRWKFVDTVLRDWAKANIKNAEQARAYIEKRQQDQQQQRELREIRQQQQAKQPGNGGGGSYNRGGYNRQPVRTEILPSWYEQVKQEDEERERKRKEEEEARRNRPDHEKAADWLDLLCKIQKDPAAIAEQFTTSHPTHPVTAEQAQMIIDGQLRAADLITQ
jgi:DnaD/phage-associated family protein